ncbi:MAG: mycothiol conjugate amidase Mca [Acidimicrobiales bacterium]
MSAESRAAGEPLSILTVHAHPDDESSKGPGTIRRLADEGVRTTLVCCTGGEAGDILNPAMDRPEVVDNLGEVRRRELQRAADIIGYGEIISLGYRDSGMPDSEHNKHPEAFANIDTDVAVARLVEIIRRVRPQVIVTYPEDQSRYPHPDHLKVTEISLPAWDLAGDPDAFPELGEPWVPLKLYCSMWSRRRMVLVHEKFAELGLESPYDEKWFDRPDQDHHITTSVEVDNSIRRLALLAHETQIDPTSPFWFGLPDHVQDAIHPFDDYMLMRSRIDTTMPETDLFAGLR